jgi:branched-chain amino acid transport system permease protein
MTLDLENTSQKTTLKSPLKSWGGFVVGMLILGIISKLISADGYYNSLANAGFLFGGLATAWNILGGYCGQFSFGHAVFVGIGAYSVALTKTDHNWGTIPGIILGIMISIAVAMAISWPLFRLRGSFFAIGTLAFSEVALSLAMYFTWTHGALGVQIPFERLPIVDQKVWLLVFFVYLVFCMGTSLFLIRGRIGYYMISVRDDEATAAASGINPLTIKTIAFAISAALTSLGGSLYVLYLGNLDPRAFLSTLEIGAFIPLLALIGGLGTVVGPLLGALFLEPGQTYLRGQFAGSLAGISQGTVGIILILAALYFRHGFWGAIQGLARRLQRISKGASK